MASKAAAATGADVVFTELEVHDLRWPTSKTLDGSDAMHKDPGEVPCGRELGPVRE